MTSLIFVLATTAAAVDPFAVGLMPKDLWYIAVPILSELIKKTLPTDEEGKLLKPWRKVMTWIPMLMSIGATFVMTGEISLISLLRGVVFGGVILGFRNFGKRISGR